ncbi:MAG: hypothetical protein ACOX64_06485 [Candidatus Merdivicinus sp.]|jgi:hypothetical protein
MKISLHLLDNMPVFYEIIFCFCRFSIVPNYIYADTPICNFGIRTQKYPFGKEYLQKETAVPFGGTAVIVGPGSALSQR